MSGFCKKLVVKYKRNLWTILFVVVWGLLLLTLYQCGEEITTAQDAELIIVEDEILVCDVIRIIDGDTIVVQMHGVELSVRVLGVDTPERGQDGFVEAGAFTSDFVRAQVILIGESGSGAIERDRFGRILAYVHNVAGMDLSAALITSGHAIVYTKYRCDRTALYLLIEKLINQEL